jgi:hypothetical protein
LKNTDNYELDGHIPPRASAVPTSAVQGMLSGLKRLPHVLAGLGFDSLREGQDVAVKTIMSQRDSVVILPTATGKSACFVVPTLAMQWRAIVIYPLVALMRDQATSMQRKGLSAATISSQESDAHNAAVLRDWASGELQFMLVSPERFANEAWANVVTQFPPDIVAMDECFSGDVEILTEGGFVRFDELDDGTRVAQVNPETREVSYVTPTNVIRRPHVGNMIRLWDERGVDLMVTPNHDLLRYRRRDKSWQKVLAGQAKFSHAWMFLGAPTVKKGRDELTPRERLQVAYQADGNRAYQTDNRCSPSYAAFSFSKQSNIDRFLQIMEDGEFDWVESDDVDARRRRRFLVRDGMYLSKEMRGSVDLGALSTAGCRALVEEAIAWGNVSESLGYYSSTEESNADFFQEACVLAGMRSRKARQADNRRASYKDVHRLYIRRGEPWIDTQSFRSDEVAFEGTVYCVEVPEGCIVVRRDGKPVVIGNCHTFHEWADTFRHGYKVCGQFIQKVQPRVVVALSATLSEKAEKEVREGLGIADAKLVYHYPRRANLHLASLFLDNMTSSHPWVVENCEGATIVYASTQKRTEEYAEAIGRYTNRQVMFYHGGMSQKDRKYCQDKFMSDDNGIIVATNAFGMGVDKGDIRNVVHFDVPGTLVALAQECGRAGRDGKDSTCTIIPTADGIKTRRHFIRCGNPTPKDIRAFFKAAEAMKEGRHGAITARRADIAARAGVDKFAIDSIMTFCLGEQIFGYDEAAARQHRIRFALVIPTLTKTEQETRDAIYDVGLEVNGWWEFDVEALSEQCERSPSTVVSRLRSMHEKGLIDWVKASSSRPLRITRQLSEVPQESFDRLAEKAARAEADLQLVLAYADTADDKKHDFLESHLNR